MYEVKTVTYPSHEDTITGTLFFPENRSDQVPCYLIIGPICYVKEQAPLQYATRLAGQGFAALIFDPRYFGESSGNPRQFDDPASKVNDLKASITFLETLPQVDSSDIRILGVCMGSNWATEAAASDDRVNQLTVVAGAYLSRKDMVASSTSESEFDTYLRTLEKRLEAYRQDGIVEYQTMVDPDIDHSFFTMPVPRAWYPSWAQHDVLPYKGLWENRIATLSEYGLWSFDVAQAFSKLTVPVLMIDSEHSATSLAVVQELFEMIPHENKTAVNLGEPIQTQFYDDPVTIDSVVNTMVSTSGN